MHKMDIIDFLSIDQTENLRSELAPLRDKLEARLNLEHAEGADHIDVPETKINRICLLVGLSLPDKRSEEEVLQLRIPASGSGLRPDFFTYQRWDKFISAMLKLRYHDCIDTWTNATTSRAICREILRGRDYLMANNGEHLEAFLLAVSSSSVSKTVPALDLRIGSYGDNIPAELHINDKKITNTQILVAGATGSGKTNLLAVLIEQLRTCSCETAYPVNFLLFDYKGEFSDPQNRDWLRHFQTDETCLYNPINRPLPFTPFRDFSSSPIQELNLYATEMANALLAIDRASISARMGDRLRTCIIETYKQNKYRPITFQKLYDTYLSKIEDKVDSVCAVLNQLKEGNLFEEADRINLIDSCCIIDLSKYPKDGPLAKAIVYFTISKLNILYEGLSQQAMSEDHVQIRHFTIIDEAHYMLDFDNRPLRNLIAVGRNKGMSIILATQNMADFRNNGNGFDFYANAQYPLIMKQQTIDSKTLSTLYGVAGKELSELQTVISGLGKGELIIKNNDPITRDMGIKYKKITVTHLT